MEQLPMFSDAIEYENFNQQDYYDLDEPFRDDFYKGRFAYVFGTEKISIYDTWKQRKYSFSGKYHFIYSSSKMIELDENKLLVLYSDSEDVYAYKVTLNLSNRSYKSQCRRLNLYPQPQLNITHLIAKTNVQNTILIDVRPNRSNIHSVFLYNYETNVNQRLITYERDFINNFHFDENTQRFYIVKDCARESRRFELVSTATGMMLRALETVRLSTGYENYRLLHLNVCFEHNVMYVLNADYVFRELNDPTRYLNQLVKIWNLDNGTCRVFRLNPFGSPRPRMSITDGFLHVHYDPTSFRRKSQTRRHPIKTPETLFMLAWFARPKNSVMPRAITRELETDLDVVPRTFVNDLRTCYNTVLAKYQNGEFGVILTFVLFIVHHIVTFVFG